MELDFAGGMTWHHEKLKVTFRIFHFGKEVTFGGFLQCTMEADWGCFERIRKLFAQILYKSAMDHLVLGISAESQVGIS